jgi:hypothetical protein
LKQTKYDENASLAEEKHFLKGYTIPFVQLDPMKCILVFSHVQNTFDKKELLDSLPNPTIIESTKQPRDFVKEPEILNFFMDGIDKSLATYDVGKPENKPDVIKQLAEIKSTREKLIQQQTIQQLQQQLTHQNQHVIGLTNENTQLKTQVKYLEEKMRQLITEQIQERVKLAKTKDNI